tara:strand:- start:435 stop:674 length:240 start_codon:yes stop_codon:yes gene_type:complete
MIKFERQYIGWGTTPNDPLEVVVRIYVPTDFEECHYHDKLHEIAHRMIEAGYATEIGYSDGVVGISRLVPLFYLDNKAQ